MARFSSLLILVQHVSVVRARKAFAKFKTCAFFLSTGSVGIFYGNKTSSQFVNFSSSVHVPGDLNTHILLYCNIFFKSNRNAY